MNRRDFLKALGLATGVSLIPVGRSGLAVASPMPLGQGGGTGAPRLVVIFLRGAVDGLNVVVPHGESAYYASRPTIAIPRPGADGGALDLDGHFGLHPALAALMPLWQQRHLAFVHAAGSPDPSRSHFDAQDYMETGTPGNKHTSDGWMNRLLGVLPGAHTPTEAVSFGNTMPRILTGRMSVASMTLGRNAGQPTAFDRPQINAAYASMYAGHDALSEAFQESQKARHELLGNLQGQDRGYQAEMQAANRGAPLPYGFADDARKVARLMTGDPNIRLVFLDLGGWDTHVNEGSHKGQLANHLKPLGDGLAALAGAMGPQFRDTTVLVMSEFGRTVHENGTGGTDHGHGNVMWVLGGRVNGGRVYGQWPGLESAQLYQNRDLAVTTDFRQVIAPLLEHHLRLDDARLAKVFPGMPGTANNLGGLIRV